MIESAGTEIETLPSVDEGLVGLGGRAGEVVGIQLLLNALGTWAEAVGGCIDSLAFPGRFEAIGTHLVVSLRENGVAIAF